MSDRETDPIDPQLRALLTREGEAGAPASALGRVWTRVVTNLGPGAARDAPANRGGPLGRAVAYRAHLAAFVALLGGVAIGAGLHAALQRPSTERIVFVDRPPSVTPSRPEEPSAGAPASAPSAAPVLAPLRPVVRPSPQPSSSLSAERALLDEARRALSQDDGARALALAGEHEHRFAQPQLAEEREAIAIQALVLRGRYDEARARAARFRAASPNSLFLPAVDASLASIP